MQPFRPSPNRKPRRRGATIVEVAIMLPVFGLILMGMMETGHAMMVVHLLGVSARQAARSGSVDGVTSQQVIDRAIQMTNSGLKVSPTVTVKDGSSFDDPAFNAEEIDISALPALELNSAEDNQMFIVHLSVPYNDVAIIPPFWMGGFTLTSQAVMRHE